MNPRWIISVDHRRKPPKGALKAKSPKFKQQFAITFNFKTIRARMSVTITNRKSHTVFRLITTLMTLNDLEPRDSTYFALFHRIRLLCRPITSPYLKIDLYCMQNISSSIFGHNWPTLQHDLSAIAELLVDAEMKIQYADLEMDRVIGNAGSDHRGLCCWYHSKAHATSY